MLVELIFLIFLLKSYLIRQVKTSFVPVVELDTIKASDANTQ